jgi:hypothetical protein
MSSQQGYTEGAVHITIVNVLSAGGTGYCTHHKTDILLTGGTVHITRVLSAGGTVRITELIGLSTKGTVIHRKQFIPSLQTVQYTSHNLAAGGTPR